MKRTNPDRRTPVACGRCGQQFLRTQNTGYCSDECRFLAKVDQRGPESCWAWLATLDRHGYGTFFLGRNVGAHRAAYELFREPIPEGRHLDHLCRNRACVNPAHLEPVDQRTNTLRGDAPSAIAWRGDRCKVAGHPRTPENTYQRGNGHRQCRICMRTAEAKRRAA